MLVVPAHHRLARHGDSPLPLSALGELDLLLPSPGTPLRDEIDLAVRPSGVTLHPSIELDGLRLIASLTFDGYGPSILPASAVPHHLRERFRLVQLEGVPRRRVGIALRSHGLPSAPTRALIDILYDVMGDQASLPEGLHPAARTDGR
jgi:hypothetical protein